MSYHNDLPNSCQSVIINYSKVGNSCIMQVLGMVLVKEQHPNVENLPKFP